MKKFLLRDPEGNFALVAVANSRYPLSFAPLAAAQQVYDLSNEEWFKYPLAKANDVAPTFEEYCIKHNVPKNPPVATAVTKTTNDVSIVVAFRNKHSGFYCGSPE